MRTYKNKLCACGCGDTFTPTGPAQKTIKGHVLKPGCKPVEPKHEFEEYESKDTQGKREDSVCLRTWMAAGNIALIELGMDSIEIEKHGLLHSVRRTVINGERK